MLSTTINAGIYKGRNLDLPPNTITRAVSSKVRAAIFNMIDVNGKSILDLFAGGGTLGFEALSEGAKHCTFVDRSQTAIKVIKNNTNKLDVADKVDVVKKAVESFANEKPKTYDFVFFDPPYKDFDVALVKRVANLVQLGGILVLSSSNKSTIEVPKEYELLDQKLYGDTKITYLRKR